MSPAFWLWDLYFATAAAAVVAAVATAGDFSTAERAVALGAVAAMAALHLLAGRRLIQRDVEDTASLLVCLAQLALFAVAIASVPVSTWLMFAVVPLIFQMVRPRLAIALVVGINVVPVVVEFRADPDGLGMDLVIAALSTSTGICLGLWIMQVVRQSEERATLIEELEASRAEVARLSVSAERARLAGEIHDTLAQGFTSIITLIQAADPELRDERLALAVRTARENLAESRAMVSALSPSALAAGSLPDAVRRLAMRFTDETGLPARFRITGEARELPTPVEVVLLRAAQEALTNVRRHAGAREAAVLLAYSPRSVRLVVRDDGGGFDPAAAEGFGLAGMRSRAAQVGGALTVRSEPESGTTIELEAPA